MAAQDPNLYGQAPPNKKQKKELVPSSLTFTSQLSSLLANTSSSSTIARPRPSKSKTSDLFSNVKIKRGKPKPTTNPKDESNKLVLKDILGTEEDKAERLHARRKMESKARLYAAMQRGDYIGREIGLVDFDRKWAEKHDNPNPKPTNADHSSSSGDDSSSDSSSSTPKHQPKSTHPETLVEYTDELGRTRMVTPSQKARMEARIARGQASAVELEILAGRPVVEPSNLIFGDAVQTEAFAARDAQAMEDLARKRDRSATPPPATHYEADKEIRTKGVGFFAFSKDEETRMAEMKSLEEERERTEKARKEREKKMERKRREIEARRREIGERKAKRMADSFLEGLEGDLLGGSAGGGTSKADGAGSAGSAGGDKADEAGSS